MIDVSQPSQGLYVVALSGEMDIATAPEFTSRMTRLGVADSSRVVVDLSGLTFLDSSGINALVSAAKAVEAGGGKVTLAAPTSHIRQVFDIVQLSDVVAIEPSLEAALGNAQENGAGGP